MLLITATSALVIAFAIGGMSDKREQHDGTAAQVQDARLPDHDAVGALHPVSGATDAGSPEAAGEAARGKEPAEEGVDAEPTSPPWCANGYWQIEPDGTWTCLATDAKPTSKGAPAPEPLAGDCCFVATRYGQSYEGSPLGCPGITLPAGRPDKLYHSADPAILAAPPARYQQWECGQGLWIVNPANGRRLYVVRVDSCPGCSANHVDLSEAGMAVLCGVEYPETCDRLTGLVIEEAW